MSIWDGVFVVGLMLLCLGLWVWVHPGVAVIVLGVIMMVMGLFGARRERPEA